MLFMPESPYLSIVKGREEQARKSLKWLRGKHYSIEEEITLMKATHKEQEEIGRISIINLLSEACYLKPFLIMMTLHFVQQFCGINAIVFNLALIFEAAGFNIDSSLAAAAQVSVTQASRQFCQNLN